MIQYYKTVEGQLLEQNCASPGVWIHLNRPTKEEIEEVCAQTGVLVDLLTAALDEEEAARIEREEDQTLVLVDIPVVEPEGTSFVYNTIPLGIVLLDNMVITVCLEDTTIIEDFMENRVKGFDTCKKTRFVLQLLYRTSTKFLQYLRQIDKASTQVETALHKSMKNRELIQMLKLEKSLVYFSTSLKGNEVVLEKMLKTNFIKRYPDDEDLLEDVIIENKQAIEMAAIYREILTGTMDAFASVISNNLNIVMKLLTSITIIMAVPTMVASLWGMNVPVPFQHVPTGFYIVLGISLVITAIVALVLWRKKML
ncbi:MAG: magnesium transporter CorA family protein [Christensenellaceae bacterium]|nr:magnesium transporter CorA family protein [Christensenellaceae bacterium]